MPKAFSWSFSRLKNYETCPKRYYEIDIQKNYKESSAQLDWGGKVHEAMADAIKTGTPLPTDIPFQRWINSVNKFKGEKLVEQKWALTKEFQPTEWFSPLAWFRSVGDFVGIAAPGALILDWKTGKPTRDSQQLMLTAACVFAFHPDVHEVDSGFVWLKDDAITSEHYTRADMPKHWMDIIPRVQRMEQATATLTFPPQPDRLCKKYCPVSSCPFWRKGPQG
jgi:hypothetical protein